jgi:hypothetical protein
MLADEKEINNANITLYIFMPGIIFFTVLIFSTILLWKQLVAWWDNLVYPEHLSLEMMENESTNEQEITVLVFKVKVKIFLKRLSDTLFGASKQKEVNRVLALQNTSDFLTQTYPPKSPLSKSYLPNTLSHRPLPSNAFIPTIVKPPSTSRLPQLLLSTRTPVELDSSLPSSPKSPSCKICFSSKPNCVFISCFHGGICYECGIRIFSLDQK